MIQLAYWVLLIGLSALFLRLACSLCRTYQPSWPRALFSTLFIVTLAYIVFDFSAYLLMRSMQDVVLQVPTGYSYIFWFHEPLAFKWLVISQGGPLRYLPIVFSLCVAGMLQMMVLQADVTFRWGVVIVLMQWAATLVAGYFLALFMGLAVTATLEQVAQRKQAAPGKAEPAALQLVGERLAGATELPQKYAEHAWTNLKTYADSHIDELKEDLQPVTRHLPGPVMRFLDAGGWWGVFSVLGIIALFWLRAVLGKLKRALKPTRKKKRGKKRVIVDLREDLEFIGPALTDEGPQRLKVSGLPARLRLVILSLATRSGGELSEEMADRVLDWLKPGLAKVTAGDYPRVRVWPFYPSAEGFTLTFARQVAIPEGKGQKSHWVLVSGQVTMGPSRLHVGLALYADEPNTLRHIKVEQEKWLNLIGISEAPELARSR